MSKKSKNISNSDELGAWEKHTKGIGRKLLEKFGFKGRLGAKEDGIGKAIEVSVRPAGLGLGFGDTKKRNKHEIHIEDEDDDDYNNIKKVKTKSLIDKLEKNKSWKKGSKSINIDLDSYHFESSTGIDNKTTTSTVIDMRHEDIRIISDVSGIKSLLEPKLGEELIYNLSMMNNKISQSLIKDKLIIDNYYNNIEDKQKKIEILKDIISEDLIKINRLKEINQLINDMKLQMESNELNVFNRVKHIVSCLYNIYDSYNDEFKLFDLLNVIPNTITSICSELFTDWDPLSEPFKLHDFFIIWKPLTLYIKSSNDKILIDQLHNILSNILTKYCIPIVIRNIVNQWDPIDYEPYIFLIESIIDIGYEDISNELIINYIIPKLKDCIDNYNINDYDNLIHTWVIPWLPIAKSNLSIVYPDIRRKINKQLEQWNMSNQFAITILKPWINIFDVSSYDKLIVKSVIPKVITSLRNFVINPKNQNLSIFPLFIECYSIIPLHHYICLLLGEFFPNWLVVLSNWLKQRNINYNEIVIWYNGWKSLFHKELLNDSNILLCFNKALDLIDTSLDNQISNQLDDKLDSIINDYIDKYSINYFNLINYYNTMTNNKVESNNHSTNNHNINDDISLKDIIEDFALTNDLLFTPKIGYVFEGKQLYRLGNCVIYIDRDVIYYHRNNDYIPISLDDLLIINKSK